MVECNALVPQNTKTVIPTIVQCIVMAAGVTGGVVPQLAVAEGKRGLTRSRNKHCMVERIVRILEPRTKIVTHTIVPSMPSASGQLGAHAHQVVVLALNPEVTDR
jgi:hypothetical protein